MTPLLEIQNLSHVYSEGTPFEHAAIRDLSLSVERGEFIGLIGHTGSGKSTLIQHLNGLLKPTSGKILYNGEDIWKDAKFTRQIRYHVGLVFQYPEYQLFEETVYKDIAFGPRNMKLGEDEIDARVREAADFAGVDEELFERSPLELSGGQKRRVAIAGVIAMRPGVLVLDEPTAGLDPEGCRQILANIMRYKEKTGSSVLIVSHNMDDVARLAERILVFSNGGIVMDGRPDEVFSQPEKLMEIGLSVPHATEIAMALRAHGVALPGAIYTHEQLRAAILEKKGAGVC